jgi:hypothetical protein
MLAWSSKPQCSEPSEVEHAYVSDESHRFGRRNDDALAMRAQGQYE